MIMLTLGKTKVAKKEFYGATKIKTLDIYVDKN